MVTLLPGSLHSDPLGQMDINVKTMMRWETKGEKGPQQPGVDYHKLLRRPTWESWVSGFPTIFSLSKLHHNKQQPILSVLEFGASHLCCCKIIALRSTDRTSER